MPNYLVFNEGHIVDDAGYLLTTSDVDLRDPAERTPIATLIKG